MTDPRRMTAGERLRWMQRRGLAPLPPQQPLRADAAHARRARGDGDGSNYGDGLGYGDGYGDGNGFGYGYGDGYGDGHGYGDVDSNGDGNGNGYGG